MKKALKNLDLTLISQLILSILVLVIGIVVMIFKSFGLLDLNLYISILFYIYAFFSTIFYFVKRKEGDYELLILSLINIITATFMFVFKEDNTPMILGAAMTIYTVLLILNRGYKVLTLQRMNNFMWVIKFIITFLIAFLGMLTSFNLFNEVTVQTLMFGYYFVTLGFMLTAENLIEMFVTDGAFRKMLSKVLKEESKLEEVKETEIKEENKEKPKEVKNTNKTKKKNETIKKEIKPLKIEETKKTKKEITKPVKQEKTKETPKKKTVTKKETKSEIKKEVKKEIKKTKPTKKTTPKKQTKTKSSKTTETKRKVGRPKKSS